MYHPWVYRLSVLLAICTFAVVIAGGLLQPDALILPPFHIGLVLTIGVLTIALAVMLLVVEKRPWLRNFGLALLAIGIAQGGLGTKGVLQTMPGLATIAHACLGQLFLSSVVAMVAFTSEKWEQGPELVRDQGWPSLRSLAVVMPVFVFIQVALGAGFRHQMLGIMPHILGAMIATLLILITCMFALQQFPQHRSLRPAAIRLAVATSLQVLLGISVITLETIHSKDAVSVTVSVTAHIATGALTLASAILLGIQIRRNVQPAAETGTSPAV